MCVCVFLPTAVGEAKAEDERDDIGGGGGGRGSCGGTGRDGVGRTVSAGGDENGGEGLLRWRRGTKLKLKNEEEIT